jgi:hypothetical protein
VTTRVPLCDGGQVDDGGVLCGDGPPFFFFFIIIVINNLLLLINIIILFYSRWTMAACSAAMALSLCLLLPCTSPLFQAMLLLLSRPINCHATPLSVAYSLSLCLLLPCTSPLFQVSANCYYCYPALLILPSSDCCSACCCRVLLRFSR